jgi:predicted nucleic acid-binding protein
MKRLLVDTNVLLDVLLDRKPYSAASSAVWKAVETNAVEGLLAGHALTTIFYIARKDRGAAHARQTVRLLLRMFRVAPIHERMLLDALELGSSDFEDDVTAVAAQEANCDLIVTRDPRGFRSSHVRAVTPEAAAAALAAG